MKGRRVYPNENGWLTDELEPGDYGRATNLATQGRPSGWWQVRAPDGSQGSLSPNLHTVVEHDDGSITVTPSIDFSQRRSNGWHGYLERGTWRSV